MIRINNVEYECKSFTYQKQGNTEYLHIVISGDLKDNNNKLHIDYNNNSYFGCKLLPIVTDGITDFLVYIFQEGDKELL